jgi:hypothetical protein
MTDTSEQGRDFFISFTQADRAWAIWIAWTLERAGYSVFVQDWDFKGNFVLEMDRAHALSRRTIAVLSPDYFASRFTASEWTARFAEDAGSEYDLLIPVLVRPCEPKGLLAQIVFVDLVGCKEEVARERVLSRVRGIRLKPDEPPLFPSEVSHTVVPGPPAFPAAARTTNRVRPLEHVPLHTRGGLSPAPWLVGGIAVAVMTLVATAWLLAFGGPNVTATGGVAAGRDITNGSITIDGATKP